MVGLLEEGIVGHRSVGVWNITVAYYCRCANEWMLEVWSGLLSSGRCAVERIVGGCCAKRHAGDVCSMNLNFMCAVNDGLKISKFWFLKKSDPLLVLRYIQPCLGVCCRSSTRTASHSLKTHNTAPELS